MSREPDDNARLSQDERAIISELTSREELEELGRFRYRVYVEEMKRQQKYADHIRKTIVEPHDESSTILVARSAKRIVGTLRISFCSKTSFAEYEQKYHLSEFAPYFPRRCTVTTKLMVCPQFRCSTLPMQLICSAFRHACELGNLFDFIDCNAYLRPMFTRFGYRQIFPDYVDEEYGTVSPLVLVCGDREHLERCRSPFRKQFLETPDSDASVRWFMQRFTARDDLTRGQPAANKGRGVNIFEGMPFPDCW